MHPELYELKALVAGSLGPARRKEIDAHIAVCGECSRQYVMLCVGKSTPPAAEPRVATPPATVAAAPRPAVVAAGAPAHGDTIITLDGSADPNVVIYGIDAPLGGMTPSVVALPTPSPILPIEPARRAAPSPSVPASAAPVRPAAPPAPAPRPATAMPIAQPSPQFTTVPPAVAARATVPSPRMPLAELPKVAAATVPAILPPAAPPAPRRLTPPVLAQLPTAMPGPKALLQRITGAHAALTAAANGTEPRAVTTSSRRPLFIGIGVAATLLLGVGGMAAYRTFQSSVASAASAAAAAAAKAVADRQAAQVVPAGAPAAPRTERVIVYRDRVVPRAEAAPAPTAETSAPAPVTVDTRALMDVAIPEVNAVSGAEDDKAALARSVEADMRRSTRGTADRTRPKP